MIIVGGLVIVYFYVILLGGGAQLPYFTSCFSDRMDINYTTIHVKLSLTIALKYMWRAERKTAFGHKRTVLIQIRLRIRPD